MTQRTPTPPPSSKEEDLERTAELPILDVAAFEPSPTWIAERAVRSRRAALRAGKPAAGSGKEVASQLAQQLAEARNAQATAEQRLEDLARELVQARKSASVARAELDARAAREASLQDERILRLRREEELQAELTERDTRLASLEQKVGELSAGLELREEQLREAEQLQELLAGREERIRVLEAAAEDKGAALQQHQGEIDRLRATQERLLASESTAAQRTSEQGEALDQAVKRHEELEAALLAQMRQAEQLEGELARLRRQLHEQVTSAEGSAAAQLDRDAALAAVSSRAEELAAELAKQQDALDAAVGARTTRVRELEGQLTEHQARARDWEAAASASNSRMQALQAQLSELQERAQALEVTAGSATVRAQELEGQLSEQLGSSRILEAAVSASTLQVQALQERLQAAEEALKRQGSELERRSAQLAQAERTGAELRVVAQDARLRVSERDALIKKLREEVAASAGMLRVLQQQARPGSNERDLPPLGAARLLIRTDQDTEIVHVLGVRTSIGRSPDNDVQVDATSISRHHALILTAGEQTTIEDLHSTNGVRVNGRRITRQPLQDGDMIAVGKAQFRYVLRVPHVAGLFESVEPLHVPPQQAASKEAASEHDS